ncbi:MAG: hypothetical protein CMJ31_03465 [Phycisphaerae bacterium]|nr:hypothetical protein [Phycisphaerae bacterium]
MLATRTAIAALCLCAASHAHAQPTTRPNAIMTLSSSGVQANSLSLNVAISADGRHVFYANRSTNLVIPATVGQQIFAHDRDPDANGVFDEGNGVTTLMSLGVDGLEGNGFTGGFNGQASIDCSADGRFVIWQSQSTNLIPADGSGRPNYDVFIRDRDPDGNGVFDEGNGVNERINEPVAGGEPSSGDNGNDHIAISDDGRYVAYSSSSTNLVAPSINSVRPGIYVRDRLTQTNLLIQAPDINFGFRYPDISGDGEWVVYAGFFLTGGQQVVVRPRAGGAAVTVSRNDNGDPGDANSGTNPNSHGPRISRDGRFVVFGSFASNLDVARPADQPNMYKLFIHDRDADGNGVFDEPGGFTTRRMDVGPGGVGGSAFPADPEISADGARVVFSSSADNLVPGDALPGFQGRDIFLYERATAALSIVSRNDAGTQATAQSFDPKIAADGASFIFRSAANNLVANDSNFGEDVFARDLPPTGCSAADLAAPFGALDIADVVGFLSFFGAMDPRADLAAPAGTFDIADVVTFLSLFGAGCP